MTSPAAGAIEVLGVLIVTMALVLCGHILLKKRRARKSPVPVYWESAGSDLAKALKLSGSSSSSASTALPDLYPVKMEHRPLIQEMMNETSGQPQEMAFRLVRACRVENLGLWAKYRESAKVVSQARGKCSYASRPPTNVQMVEQIGAAAFLSGLNTDVNEAYLWFGTNPVQAQRIANEGFSNVDGDGGLRFAEDMAKADKSAQPGTGLYQDCFAMLLCRVTLGKQQPPEDARGAEGRDSDGDAAQGACDAVRYDSAIEEGPGGAREFVPYCASLVYPEYMLVYERCDPCHLVMGAEHSRYWEYAARHIEDLFRRSGSLRSDYQVAVPGYWSNWNTDRSFRDLYPAVRFKPVIQRLMDSTWEAKYTRDRKGADGLRIPKGDPNGDMPTGVRVLKVLRVEDSEMWQRYATALADISAHRSLCNKLVGHPANTVTALDAKEGQRLAPSVNEVYLWHGSAPQAVMSIAQAGFDLDLTGSATGAMFGRGAYFAESASKADEYSSDDRDGYYQGYFAMLLCRVVLGEVQHLLTADTEAHDRTGPEMPYDSTLGDREAAVGTYREFVVPSQDQIYPEYAIIYERLYERNRVR